jgi:hypothetical protein
MNKKLDAELAVKFHGWMWENRFGRRELLVPPEDNELAYCTARYDENGIPHYLPEYSKEIQK